MDIVIILGKGSQWQNNEIRFTLRGIKKHVKNYGKIFVVGEYPSFLDSEKIIHIPFKETKAANINIADKLLAAANHPDVSKRFYYMQDDTFLTQDVDLKKKAQPYYFKGTLDTNRVDYYGQLLKDTQKVMKENKNFDNHYPLVFDKELLIEAYNHFEYWKYKEGLGTKTMYCQYAGIKGKPLEDNKFNGKKDYQSILDYAKERWCISTSDQSINKHFIKWCLESYHEQAEWEIIDYSSEPLVLPKGHSRIKTTFKAKQFTTGTILIRPNIQCEILVKNGFAVYL